MSDYKETSTTGKTWQRCYSVNISNHLNQPARAVFFEEAAAQFGVNTIVTPIGNCQTEFDPVVGQIELRDPTTGTLTGQTATHAELYAILYSLYMQAAEARDAAAT
jgi:hypothetical protein